jgi:hypothetical protein
VTTEIPPFVVEQSPGRVDGWSRTRLPFQPVGQMLTFRSALRQALSSLEAADGEQLHAIYETSAHGDVDVENVLIYNVGTAAFLRSCHSGLLIERRLIAQATDQHADYNHHHSYRIEPVASGRPIDGRPLVSLGPSDIPAPGTSIAPLWLALRRGSGRSVAAVAPGARLGLEIRVGHPSQRRINLANVVKVVVDSVMATFSRFPASPDDPAVQRLADRLALPVGEVVHLFEANPVAVLGDRTLLRARLGGYHWYPDDGNLDVISLVADTHPSRDQWTLSADLFELAIAGR